jgi:hypothetical protein
MVRLPPWSPGAWDHAWITAALAHESNIRALRADMIIAQPTSLRTVPGCSPRRIASAMANSLRRYTDVAAAAMKLLAEASPRLQASKRDGGHESSISLSVSPRGPLARELRPMSPIPARG